jgi:hypothetical protein
MMMRLGGRLLVLVVLLCLPLGCESPTRDNPAPVTRSQSSGTSYISFTEILPEGWRYLKTRRLDTNHDEAKEWVVLYQFDLPNERKTDGGPIGAIIYQPHQPDDAGPADIRAHNLRPPDSDYLCECDCKLRMEDILSGLDGDELIIEDHCNEAIPRAAIFQWDPNEQTYESAGHFDGDNIEIDQNTVIVETRLQGRAQLSRIETYYPHENKIYYQQSGQCSLLKCRKEELAFCHGEPEDATRSPYPEKVVLAFYNHFADQTAATYFTEEGWAQVQQCGAGQCGCRSARSEILHVRVIDLTPEQESYSQSKDISPDRAIIRVTVVCENRDGASEDERSMGWRVIREADRWLLNGPQ